MIANARENPRSVASPEDLPGVGYMLDRWASSTRATTEAMRPGVQDEAGPLSSTLSRAKR
jgi:hypothetical protein